MQTGIYAGSACNLSIINMIAAMIEPVAMIMETVGTLIPDTNRKPAKIGAITAPPRPSPIEKPVPVALTWAG